MDILKFLLVFLLLIGIGIYFTGQGIIGVVGEGPWRFIPAKEEVVKDINDLANFISNNKEVNEQILNLKLEVQTVGKNVYELTKAAKAEAESYGEVIKEALKSTRNKLANLTQ